MSRILMFIILAMLGMLLSVAAGIIGFPFGLMIGLFGGLIPFMAIIQIIGLAKQKGLLALFKDLEKDEKFIWMPDRDNKMHLLIMKYSNKGILYLKGLGLFEDKGTSFLFGKDKMGFALPESGYTLDVETEQYFSKLKKDKKLDDWDACVKAYLTEKDYILFQKRFRAPGREANLYKINEELDWLVDRLPKDKLEKIVKGETIDFRSRCMYLKYNYDPTAAENATDMEKIRIYKLTSDYRDAQDFKKYKQIGMMIFIVILAIVIFISVLSALDLSAFSNLFGGF